MKAAKYEPPVSREQLDVLKAKFEVLQGERKVSAAQRVCIHPSAGAPPFRAATKRTPLTRSHLRIAPRSPHAGVL
jgi:hypothetical protein